MALASRMTRINGRKASTRTNYNTISGAFFFSVIARGEPSLPRGNHTYRSIDMLMCGNEELRLGGEIEDVISL